MQPVTFDELKPKIVLGVGAHPDDLDFGAGGIFAKWADAGSQIYYLVLTDGSKGSDNRQMSTSDLIKTRRQEQKAAADLLGVADVFFCEYEDTALECSQDVKLDIARRIRQVKPDVVVTMDPTMVYDASTGFINHPDHRAAGQAAIDAVFPLARDHLTFPELLAENLEPHLTPILLLINLERQNWFEDITGTIDKKLKALAAHKSQSLAKDKIQKMMKNLAAKEGKKHGCDYAEGFMRIDVK